MPAGIDCQKVYSFVRRPVVVAGYRDADLAVGVDRYGQHGRRIAAHDGKLHVGRLVVGQQPDVLREFDVAFAVEGDHLVAGAQPCVEGGGGGYAVDAEGRAQHQHLFVALRAAEVDELLEGDREALFAAVALDDDRAVALGQQQRHGDGVHVVDRLSVDRDDFVAVLEA